MSKGVIAAGSHAATSAGAEILAAGGNAVDAAVAACFAVGAGEPTLTSLAGGGAMLHRDGASGEVTICDFFANAPGLGLAPATSRAYESVHIDFGPTTQRFHVGAAAAAMPGTIPGLCLAAEKWGRLPLEDLVAPACRMLHDGTKLEPMGAWVTALLEPIVKLHAVDDHSPFVVDGRLIEAGERFAAPQLAATLEALVARGWRDYLDKVLHPLLVAQCGPAMGGSVTDEDVASYQVQFRRPLEMDFEGCRVFTNPQPAAGGVMIGSILDLLGQRPSRSAAPGSLERIRSLAVAMKVADEARAVGASVLADPASWRQRFRAAHAAPLAAGGAASGPGSTTHVSVLDAAGNCAAVTFTYGEGNGQVLGDTGILMNNLMGEEDLFPDGLGIWPAGKRLATMMAPTLVATPTGDLIVIGGGGSNRIRSALAQVLLHLVDDGMSLGDAVAAERVHFEAGVLNVERVGALAAIDCRQLQPAQLVEFDAPNMFFGGVNVVRRDSAGVLTGAGDPRRGGCHIVVD
ncbi:MAG: gamma-glutamyltransferase [Planctomycetota bacterium]